MNQTQQQREKAGRRASWLGPLGLAVALAFGGAWLFREELFARSLKARRVWLTRVFLRLDPKLSRLKMDVPGETPLWAALAEGENAPELADVLLNAGADPDAPLEVPTKIRTIPGPMGAIVVGMPPGSLDSNPLLKAIDEGSLELVEKLLAAGANPEGSPPGARPLRLAMTTKGTAKALDADPVRLAIAEALLLAGATMEERWGWSPLMMAFENESPEWLAIFAKAGARFDESRVREHLLSHVLLPLALGSNALPERRREVLWNLLEAVAAGGGAPFNVPADAKGGGMLSALIRMAHKPGGAERFKQMARWLIEHGADPDLPDASGRTPADHFREFGWDDLLAAAPNP
jgi:ankyrin repeat protein